MHKALLAVIATCACSGKSTEPQGAGSGAVATATQSASVPTTKVAGAVVAEPALPPPVLVIVNAAGKTSVNAAPSWDAIAKMDLAKGAHAAERKVLEEHLAEGQGLGEKPTEIVASFDRKKDDLDLGTPIAMDDTRTGSGIDEPPPPEDEDMPEDGPDESGGTGTAVTLDESKMNARKPGEYQMKRTEDPRIGQYRFGGYRGPLAKYTGYAGIERASTIVGEVARDGKKLDRYQRGVVLADPRAKATAMIDAVLASQGLIAVATDKGVRPLRIQFVRDFEGHGAPKKWIELHVGATALAFEAVPDVPVAAPSFDQAAFAGALAKARDSRKLDPRAPVDVLVDPEVDAQRLVDAIVALDQAGVTMIGLGTTPTGDEAKQRGARRSDVAEKPINAQGDLSKALIRKIVGESLPKIHACYDKALAKKPDLAGRVNVQFFIKPDGKVSSSSAAGVDPGVATCIAAVIKTLAFGKVPGGGGVQVNYPFALEP